MRATRAPRRLASAHGSRARASAIGLASERGQAAAELVAIVPLLIVALLALGQAAVAGYAAWSAANAARAGARAAEVGGDAERRRWRRCPTRSATAPRWSSDGASGARARAPALLPGLPSLALTAGAALDPAPADGV